MNSLDSTQTNLDKPQPDAERQSVNTLVDMANPTSVRKVFMAGGDQAGAAHASGDYLTFHNPYGGKEELAWHGHDEDAGGNGAGVLTTEAGILNTEVNIANQLGQYDAPQQEVAQNNGASTSDSIATATATATTTTTTTAVSGDGNIVAASPQGSGTNLDQQIEGTLLQIEQGIQLLSTELSQIFGSSTNLSPNSGETSIAGNQTPPSSPAEFTSQPTNTSTTDQTDSTTIAPAQGDTTTTAPTQGDATTSSASTQSGEIAPPAVTTPTDTTPPTTPATDSPPLSAESGLPPSLVTPTSSDSFIANLQLSDPLLAKTLTDASKTMSASGYSKLETQLNETYTGSQNNFNGSANWYSGNPNFNDHLMSSALKSDGLSAADQSALTNVLQSDMPAALASDQFQASIQKSDPTLAKVLADASKSLSKSGYSTLEGNLSTFYTGNENGTGALSNQTYLDSMLLKNSNGKLSGADQAALNNVLKADMPSAAASDTLASTLQQSDPSLANVLASAKGSLSTAGYADVENYIAENSTWNSSNDASLMNQVLAQGGLTSADASALNGVIKTDMPAALTATPSAAVAQEMAQAKEAYMNDFAYEGTNVGDIAGNPGKSGTGWTQSDQVPTGTDGAGAYSAIAPIDENNYDKNAQVQVANATIYYHLKTGGWVEAQAPSQATYWEGLYSNGNNAIQSGGPKLNADGSYQFGAPPAGDNIQEGNSTLPFNADLYDGVYETLQAKASVPDSGLGINLASDYVIKGLSNEQSPGAGESNWVPLTDQYQTLYLSTLSASELQADPPPGL